MAFARMRRSRGDGAFAASTLRCGPGGRRVCSVADFDQDGSLDALFVNGDGASTLLAGLSDGRFLDATDGPLRAIAEVYSSAWADVDGDGDATSASPSGMGLRASCATTGRPGPAGYSST